MIFFRSLRDASFLHFVMLHHFPFANWGDLEMWIYGVTGSSKLDGQGYVVVIWSSRWSILPGEKPSGYGGEAVLPLSCALPLNSWLGCSGSRELDACMWPCSKPASNKAPRSPCFTAVFFPISLRRWRKTLIILSEVSLRRIDGNVTVDRSSGGEKERQVV